MDMHHRKLDD